MNNLAIIPARSGSKGLKDKNIKLLNGKPLLAYSIEAAIESGIYSHVMVSTDSEEYARIAKEYGADVPFFRNKVTATDSASSWDVVQEVLDNYSNLGVEFSMVTLLQPTSPLRTSDDIKNAYNIFVEKKAISVVSVCEMEHSPLWCNTLDDSLSLNGFIVLGNNVQRQKLAKYYRINGAIYMVSTDAFIEDRNIYREGGFAYIMDNPSSVDIDSFLDFKIAETIMNSNCDGVDNG